MFAGHRSQAVSGITVFSSLVRDTASASPPTARPGRRPGLATGKRSHSLGLLEDLGYPPALGRGQRPGLHQQHTIADAAGVLGVVRLVLLGTAQNLAVLGVLDVVLDLDNDGLVHLVADHQAFPALAVAARQAVFSLAVLGVLAHSLASSAASSSAASSASVMLAIGVSGSRSSGSPDSSIKVMIPSSRSRITV